MMGIFDELNIRLPGPRSARPTGLRAEAEGYAASLGLTPGGPGWGDAIRDYVLNGRSHSADEPMDEPMSAGIQTSDRASVDLHGSEDYEQALPPDWEPRGEPLTNPAGRSSDLQLAQIPPEMRGRFRTPELMGTPFSEHDPKPPGPGGSLRPTLRRSFPPKGPPGRPAAEVEKRHFTTAPRRDDSAPMATRIAEGVRRLPVERREISRRYKVPQTASPLIDQYYSTMLVKEGGINQDGSFRVSPKGAVGPGQILPNTAREAARLAGMPFDGDLLGTDRAYNEMLGQAYYKDLLRQFGGDFVKAAAAYNAGPDRAKAAIRAAEKAGEARNWEKHLPPETRKYVEYFRKFNHLRDD